MLPSAMRHAFLMKLVLLQAVVLAVAGPASAEGQTPDPSLSIEINKAEQLEATCRLVFMTHNGLGTDLAELSLETVLFDTEGGVERFTLFDFRDVPAGKMRVRQFDLPDTQCSNIGKVLINGASACTGEGLTGGECIEHLDATSRIDMEISG
ncbi:hypothetical protein [Oceaniradius stylonematis]|uniref:hypothetical protein n=1 Tax=Oceaniradius stylonematis TaxID=2184161 RepID=UPI00273DD4CC|nr:hypothetical protein [Oceaniradius stylonematis]